MDDYIPDDYDKYLELQKLWIEVKDRRMKNHIHNRMLELIEGMGKKGSQEPPS